MGRARLAVVLVVASTAVLVTAVPAGALRVANAGPFELRANAGAVKIGTQRFDFTGTQAQDVHLNGTVTGTGAVTIPRSGIQFPPKTVDSFLGPVTLTIVPTHDATGTLDPISGLVSLRVRFKIEVDGTGVGNDCQIASDADPIDVNTLLSGGTTSIGFTGRPYDPGSGTTTVVNTTFAVPAANGCSSFPVNVNNEINSRYGLPSPSGQNEIGIDGFTVPLLRPALVAALVASPTTAAVNQTVTFDMSGSTVDPARPVTYRFDPEGNGTYFDNGSNSVFTYRYSKAGTFTAHGRVHDADGDFAERAVTVAVTAARPRRAVADFDGDGDTDISVFRPSSGVWFTAAPPTAVVFGADGDVPVPGDYDGDGNTDQAVFRPSTGVWYLNTNPPASVTFGGTGDIPVPADYDGDGRTDIAVFRPSTGVWYVQNPASSVAFGQSGDIPVPGDYNGDGKAELAVFRPSTGVWYLNGPPAQSPVFGQNGDIPVPADYDGDGKTDIAVFRPSTGVWYIQSPAAAVPFGASGDQPQPGDYNGDGKTDIAVYRPSTGVWYVQNPPAATPFGATGDIPLPLLSRP